MLSLVFASLVNTLVNENTPDTAQLMDDVRTAVGWNALIANAPLEVSGRTDFRGTNSQFQLVFDRTDRFLDRIEGLVPQITGFDGERCWQVGFQGILRSLVLSEREDALLRRWFLTQQWLSPDSYLEFGSVEVADDAWLLPFTLIEGHAFGTVRVAQSTQRPLSVEWESDGTLHEVRWDQYEGVRRKPLGSPCVLFGEAGAKVSLRSIPSSKAPQCQPLMYPRCRRPWPHSILTSQRKSRPNDCRQATCWCTPSSKARIWDGSSSTRVLARVALLEPSLINLLESLSVVSLPRVLAESIKPNIGRLRLCNWVRVTIRDLMMIELDLDFLSQSMGIEIGGILGFGFLGHCIVEYDLDPASIAIYDPADYELRTGDWQDLLLYQFHPCVQA